MNSFPGILQRWRYQWAFLPPLFFKYQHMNSHILTHLMRFKPQCFKLASFGQQAGPVSFWLIPWVSSLRCPSGPDSWSGAGTAHDESPPQKGDWFSGRSAMSWKTSQFCFFPHGWFPVFSKQAQSSLKTSCYTSWGMVCMWPRVISFHI